MSPVNFKLGDRVVVNSALQFAEITEVEIDSKGERRYACMFPDGYVVYRYRTELT